MWFRAPFSTHLSITRQKGLADTLKVGQTTVKNTASVGPSSLPRCTEKRKKTRRYVWFSGTSKILENRVARFPVLCCMLELTTHTNPSAFRLQSWNPQDINSESAPYFSTSLHTTDVLHISSALRDPSAACLPNMWTSWVIFAATIKVI